MPRTEKPEPLFHTPEDQFSGNEKVKLASNMAVGNLNQDWHAEGDGSIEHDSEVLAKSHGVYLEYNRAKTGREKDWMYMVRVTVPGGGPFTRDMWAMFDDLSEKYTANPDGRPSLRVTTRQNIQFHWVKKQHILDLVQGIATTGLFTLNGCGDNVRNVMGCPLSRFSNHYDAHKLAQKFGKYFQLPMSSHIQVFEIDTSLVRTPEGEQNGKHFEYAPNLLNRKFKIAFSAVHRHDDGSWHYDNCVELRTDEIGIAPMVDLRKDKVTGWHVYLGGSQGEKNGKATYAAMGLPFGVFHSEEDLEKGLDAIVKVHQEWGDRKNRHWARLKYLVRGKGMAWYRDEVRKLGASFDLPNPNFDPGPRMMHHGWHKQPSNGLWAYGAYIENGRIINHAAPAPGSGSGPQLKSMVRALMDEFPIGLMTTPNQDVLFIDIPEAAKEKFERELASYGHGKVDGKPYSRLRVLSGACVGLDTCRLAYTESEQFEPELIGELEKLGYGDMSESIGITGCERQCFRPATKTIGWIGQGPNLYALKLGGSESGRTQGQWFTDGSRWYLKQVPRKEVPTVSAALFDFYLENRASDKEEMGNFVWRVGVAAIMEHLKNHPAVTHLMEKTHDAPYVYPDDALPGCKV